MLKVIKNCIGVDEVGRGSLVGPVVAAAIFVPDTRSLAWWKQINDSKKISVMKREELYKLIITNFYWTIGIASHIEIDRINIHNASLLAMRRAVVKLQNKFDINKSVLYIDGKFLVPKINAVQKSVVAGDGKVLQIAAASIVAKVYRDRLISRLDKKFPGYNFSSHKGYATKEHVQNIKSLGMLPLHRKSFCKNFDF